MYIKDRHKNQQIKPITHFILMVLRALIVFFLIFFAIHITNHLFPPTIFCNDSLHNITSKNTCHPCPDGAICSSYYPVCENSTYILTNIGCRPQNQTLEIKLATNAAEYIHDRCGDCIESLPPLSLIKFQKLFPKVNISIYEKEPLFNIAIINDTIISKSPHSGTLCQLLELLKNNQFFVGTITLSIIVFLCIYLLRFLHSQDIENAKMLAKKAHKILAMSNNTVYMYDLKIQLRDKFAKIDRIWKHVVHFIEDDSHVLVGVTGSRHEVYWKWVQ